MLPTMHSGLSFKNLTNTTPPLQEKTAESRNFPNAPPQIPAPWPPVNLGSWAKRCAPSPSGTWPSVVGHLGTRWPACRQPKPNDVNPPQVDCPANADCAYGSPHVFCLHFNNDSRNDNLPFHDRRSGVISASFIEECHCSLGNDAREWRVIIPDARQPPSAWPRFLS